MGTSLPTRYVCGGCGWGAPPDEPHPFRCANVGDGGDHVLARRLDTATEGLERAFLSDEGQPFVRFRPLLHAYHVARAHGMGDEDFVEMVTELDEAVAEVDGEGFRTTLFFPCQELPRKLGLTAEDALWLKDETENVSGSHKGRHLFGLALWLELLRRLDREPASAPPPLAISSCGNAALAAAVVARAAGRELLVFVPPDAHPGVLERLHELDASVSVCERKAGEAGDPCTLRFREFVEGGAIPFGCQGSDNGMTLEGGLTLGYELVAEIFRQDVHLDHLIVQVGGGALGSAVVQALQEGQELALLGRLPRIHTVQTEGCHPLQRAYELVVERILARFVETSGGHPTPPTDSLERADFLLQRVPPSIVEGELRHAAAHRAEFMWPWERTPQSVAYGILDDETYDWLTLLRGMLASGGLPIVASESTLLRAHELAQSATGIPVCATGSAGLAGLLELRKRGRVADGERVALLFTGRERSG